MIMFEINTYSELKELFIQRLPYTRNMFSLIEELINVEDIKSVYTKGWLIIDKPFTLIFFTSYGIIIGEYVDYALILTHKKLDCIQKVSISVKKNDVKLNIKMEGEKEDLCLSSESDTIYDWQESFSKYLKDIFKLLTSNGYLGNK